MLGSRTMRSMVRSTIGRADLARHDQTCPDLAELDGVGHLKEGVHHTKAGVARIVHDGLAADAQGVGSRTGRRGLEVVATDPSVDQHADLVSADSGSRKRLASGQGRAIGHALTGIPKAALTHTGQCCDLARRQFQGGVHRRKTIFEGGRRDDIRGQLVADGLDGDAGVSHRAEASGSPQTVD